MAEHRETESELVARAQQALSNCSWTVGECAALWTKRYAKGRTDQDFGALIGLSGDQVYQRRRVWESFQDVQDQYPALSWSHFYAALTWDDAAECLQWASEMQATIAEMKAWRRAQRGEDLAEPAADDEAPPFDPLEAFLLTDPELVRAPEERGRVDRGGNGKSGRTRREASDEETADEVGTVAGVARSADEPGPYSPFLKGARGAAPGATAERGAAASAEQVIKRLASALEKCDQALTPGVLEKFTQAPVAVQQKLLRSIRNLASKTAGLG